MPLEFLGKTEAWILLAARIKMFCEELKRKKKEEEALGAFSSFRCVRLLE